MGYYCVEAIFDKGVEFKDDNVKKLIKQKDNDGVYYAYKDKIRFYSKYFDIINKELVELIKESLYLKIKEINLYVLKNKKLELIKSKRGIAYEKRKVSSKNNKSRR